jgi:hypothetical protein
VMKKGEKVDPADYFEWLMHTTTLEVIFMVFDNL